MEKTTALRERCDCGGELEELREAPFRPTTGPTGPRGQVGYAGVPVVDAGVAVKGAKPRAGPS